MSIVSFRSNGIGNHKRRIFQFCTQVVMHAWRSCVGQNVAGDQRKRPRVTRGVCKPRMYARPNSRKRSLAISYLSWMVVAEDNLVIAFCRVQPNSQPHFLQVPGSNSLTQNCITERGAAWIFAQSRNHTIHHRNFLRPKSVID